jgi:hypothetical protein
MKKELEVLASWHLECRAIVDSEGGATLQLNEDNVTWLI